MINLAEKSKGAMDSSSLSSINNVTCNVIQAHTIDSLNKTSLPPADRPAAGYSPVARTPAAGQPETPHSQPAHLFTPPAAGRTSLQASAPPRRALPPLRHPLQKGQKTTLVSAPLQNPQKCTLKACLGWNTTNPQCDLDVSAFLLGSDGKVPGDSWFVFYGQKESPDHSTIFSTEPSVDRESITIHLDRLNPKIQKIVFVLTIHEALEKRLNFGMVADAYIRILDPAASEELAGFLMKEYYTNVISMMIGELYIHNGIWKFNAVGNGVARDLSGLCELYGVRVED